MKWTQTLLIVLMFSPLGYASERLPETSEQVEAMQVSGVKHWNFNVIAKQAPINRVHSNGNVQFLNVIAVHGEYKGSWYKNK
ncbi:MAG: hypothetical protein ABJV04_16085 [Aliiglaciecola sp.]|uniref:hypothetical protein n=1 Tax=Aliiglaciecola sp. TaxID=1872441 RepID=UPI003299FD85